MDRSSFILLSFIEITAYLFLITSIPADSQTEFREYKSETLGVKLQIPSDWRIFQENNSTENCFGEIADCFVHITDDNSKYGFTIQMIGLTLESIKDHATIKYNYHKNNLKGFTFISDKEITIQNNPAWQMEFTKDNPFNTTKIKWNDKSTWTNKSKILEIYTKVNYTLYEITYTALDQSDYSKFLPQVQNVLNTIEFIPGKPLVKEPSFLTTLNEYPFASEWEVIKKNNNTEECFGEINDCWVYKSQPLGVRLTIPSQWEVIRQYSFIDIEECFDEKMYYCTERIINDNPRSGNYSFDIFISKESFNGSLRVVSNEPYNSSLKDFTNYKYNELETKSKNFTFVNNEEITLKNLPAWKLEYTTGDIFDDNLENIMDIYTKINNTFYEIRYLPKDQSDYYKFLPEVQNIFNTIEFIPGKSQEVKVPSFPHKPPEIREPSFLN